MRIRPFFGFFGLLILAACVSIPSFTIDVYGANDHIGYILLAVVVMTYILIMMLLCPRLVLGISMFLNTALIMLLIAQFFDLTRRYYIKRSFFFEGDGAAKTLLVITALTLGIIACIISFIPKRGIKTAKRILSENSSCKDRNGEDERNSR